MKRVPYVALKNEVLGKAYDLSYAFLSMREMRAVTLRSKKVDKVSNVLSFPLSKNSGEILICRRAAHPFSVGYLFIHGLFHIKGFKHGATMEKQERRILKQFGLALHEQNRYRN
ncbi:MAG: rRNA maturation RNAse YbeY [Candidatus Adlerbacteria bacterium]|nr:rRNA maturation RNAse YbeY [Candidatus Adlerbacteria bacterium]